MPVSLTIAGYDPTGGAGLQADLRVFWYFGVYGLSAVTSITCQNTTGVEAIYPVSADELEKQLTVLLDDIKPQSLKTGMIYSRENVEVIERCIRKYGLKNLVIDPVTVSSTGVSLLEDRTLDLLKEKLIPHSRVVTPNIYEASVLTGLSIESLEDMKRAAEKIKNMGAEAVVVTGGHLEGNLTVDVFFNGEFIFLESERIPGEFHGTGCIFSAAITAALALGVSSSQAVQRAKEFIKNALRTVIHPGKGMGILSLEGSSCEV
ncbi:MAG: bifunctional hydroxymethylpyrimidine kinase/phosphomethylpyrimidine kinase [Thermodesulfovibrionales bacterium]|nr:bifunctional hydroxymethylpyrimidine kinase/phosphomethylpyrimidine kinase [Thermodesulfovibrionales bacterium]